MISFTRVIQNGRIELNWSTATEINNHGFEVQRKGTADWQKIGFVSGNGTSNVPHNYYFTDNKATTGTFSYRLKQIDRDGKFEYSKIVEATVGITPNAMILTQNFPNPFNPETNIDFVVPNTVQTTLKVYNLLGEEVAALVNGVVEAGVVHQAGFKGINLPSGLYFYALRSGNLAATKKMLLVK